MVSVMTNDQRQHMVTMIAFDLLLHMANAMANQLLHMVTMMTN